MIDGFVFALTLFSALGCGLTAGALFAFSAFVMKALARLPSAQGIAAMQSINVAAINPLFMAALFAPAAACVVLLVTSLVKWHEPGAVYLLVGSTLYLAGTILLTIVYHVPRNDALATLDPNRPDATTRWHRYVASWTAGNHLRVAAALGAAAAFTVALRVG